MLTETAADNLPVDEATALARVIDLQAKWECLLADAACGSGGYKPADLHGRQKAYEAYRVRRAEFDNRYKQTRVPEGALNTPERVAAWGKVVRAVLRRASGEWPGVAEKVYRLTDRIAARLGTESVPRESVDAVVVLELVVAWCERLIVAPGGRSRNPTIGKAEAA